MTPVDPRTAWLTPVSKWLRIGQPAVVSETITSTTPLGWMSIERTISSSTMSRRSSGSITARSASVTWSLVGMRFIQADGLERARSVVEERRAPRRSEPGQRVRAAPRRARPARSGSASAGRVIARRPATARCPRADAGRIATPSPRAASRASTSGSAASKATARLDADRGAPLLQSGAHAGTARDAHQRMLDQRPQGQTARRPASGWPGATAAVSRSSTTIWRASRGDAARSRPAAPISARSSGRRPARRSARTRPGAG